MIPTERHCVWCQKIFAKSFDDLDKDKEIYCACQLLKKNHIKNIGLDKVLELENKKLKLVVNKDLNK